MSRALLAVLALLILGGGVVFYLLGGAPARAVANQRNLARLHAQRDSEEGYAEAIAILKDVVARPDATFEDWLDLARCRVLHGKQLAEAAVPLQRARQLGSDSRGTAALDYVEGLFLAAKQDHGAAHDAFGRVLVALPDHPEALYQCGFAAEQAGRLDEAQKRFARLIELGQLVKPASYRLARVEAQRKDEAAAQKALEVFQSRDPDEKPETLKCDLTDIVRRPYGRAAIEPAAAQVTWKVGTAASVPVTQVLALPRAAGGGADLVLIGATAAHVVDGRGGSSEVCPLDGRACGVVFDVDNAAGPELVLADGSGIRALARGADGAFAPVQVEFPPLPDGQPPLHLAAFDLDHDGDLDLLVTLGSAPHELRVLRNRGDKRFEWKTPLDVAVTAAGAPRLDAHDVDQANDLDLVVPGGADGAILALNRRGERFEQIRLPALAGREVLIVEDFDNDGAPDVFGAGGGPGWTLLRNADPHGRRYEARFAAPQHAPEGAPTAADAVAADVDNDGDLDVLLASGASLVLLRNVQGGRLVAEPAVDAGVALLQLAVADRDGDGVIEVCAATASGLLTFGAALAPRYASVEILPEGRKDNRGAVGTVVELFAGRAYQSLMIKGPLGARFGLGAADLDLLDGVRLRWPQGIKQSVPRSRLPLEGRRARFEQIEGLVASCPFLYVEGPDGWTFLTDVVGIAPLAEWLPPGAPDHEDPEEFVRIPGSALAVKDGKVRLAITEELKETTYLDRVELYYVDHDPAVELLIDENLAQGAYDPLRIQRFAESDLVPLAAARAHGADQLAKVRDRDGVYLHPYGDAPTQWGGWTEPHAMELVTGAPAAVLVLEGRLAWYDSSVTYALHQNGRTWAPLRIERVHDDGRAEVLVADAGGPTGMDRTMVVPLGATPLPAGATLRVTGQYRFLWDRIRTAPAPDLRQPDVRQAELSAAELYFHGYSEYIGDVSTHEQGYAYDDRRPDDRYPRARGFTNEYGDVRDLVTAHDDRLVILVAGDAVRFEFAAPPPATGVVRTWFMKITGWAKESCFHNPTGDLIAPLPFREMGRYPPPEGRRTPWREAASVLTRRIR